MTITFYRCRLTEESLYPQGEDPRIDEDRLARVTALCCERCQCVVDHTLTSEAGQAVCDGCLGAAVLAAATPEGSDYDATCDECGLYLREGHADDCSGATLEGGADR